MNRQKLILGACLGECVHVAGILSFLKIAEEKGYNTNFLGGATSIEKIIYNIKELAPDIVAISYRLSPETADSYLREFIQTIEKESLKDGRIFIFGGTEPVAQIARKLGFFDAVFGGRSTDEDVCAFLEGREPENKKEHYASTLLSRIAQKSPMPIIRHHYGRPTFEETLEGLKQIAEAEVLDIISLGIDQDAQENFFHPERQNPAREGAGGVPVRSPGQFRMLYDASRCGNFPLIRSYAGTSDLIRLAEVYQDTIRNCFAAIPIFWFNKIDGRGPMGLVESIKVHKEAIKWHAERHIPVEVNEPHHWALRGSHDAIYVATSFLSAYIAKKMGVSDYIMQLMFNTPPETSFKMDLAKMLAAIELVEEMQNDDFIVHRETRAGLMSYPADPYMAKGQLASSTMLQMAVNPEIIHVVAYCEADHATTAEEVIESCRIARKVTENAILGMPDMTIDPDIQYRKNCLKDEAMLIINAIRELGEKSIEDPLLDSDNLANAVRVGILDAPQIARSDDTKGELVTQTIGGACLAVENGDIISETERLEKLLERVN